MTEYAGLTCPECGDRLPPSFNSCPRCMIPIRFDPNPVEHIREIPDPPSSPCFILRPKSPVVYVLARPHNASRRLFVMGEKDGLPIQGEEGEFFRVRTPGPPGWETGYVRKEHGYRVKVAQREVQPEEALGYFRVDEHLIGWVQPAHVFRIPSAPIYAEPRWDGTVIAEIRSDVVLPVVGETLGWYMVQIPSFFRGWVAEAYGYRLLRADSLPGQAKPPTPAEVLAGIAGTVGVMTLIGAGAAIGAIADDLQR